jgi:glucose 1-dehydrogenase
MRFAVHGPGCPVASPRSHGVPRRDVDGRVHISVAGETAGSAPEDGRDGILCNGVAPGKIVTGTPGDLSQEETTAAYVRSRTPFGRFGEPEDVAAAVAFLASDEATYISGATLMVDGGWMAY